MAFILSVLVVFAILVGSEWWWRRKHSSGGEFSRKFVHITVGSFVAFWPYILTPTQIKFLSVAFIVVIVISKRLNIFSAIHAVQRPTYGELWFAVVVGVLAFTLDHPHIYTAAVLTMGLADGLAAVVGTHYGNRVRYIIFGATKSVTGTATFFAVCGAIMLGYVLLTPDAYLGIWLVPIVLGATIIENIAVNGSDNILVPLFVAGVLFQLL